MLEVKEAINGKNVILLTYSDMIEFYLDEKHAHTYHTTGLLAAGISGFFAWKKLFHAAQDEDQHISQPNNTKTTRRRKRSIHALTSF